MKIRRGCMTYKKLLVSFILAGFLLVGSTAYSANGVEKVPIPGTISFAWVKTREWLRLNLLVREIDAKAVLNDQYTDRRVAEMEYAQYLGRDNSVLQSLNRYESQKRQAFELLERSGNQKALNVLRERTLKQQRAMTELQLKIANNGDLQQNIVRVQKQVVEQTMNVVSAFEGQNAAAEVEKKTWVIWRDPGADVNGSLPPLPDKLEYAPGTAPGGGGGWVYEGGSKHIWAPGTSGGGQSTIEKSENVVSTGGSSGAGSVNNVVESDQGQTTTGNTNSNQNRNVVQGDN